MSNPATIPVRIQTIDGGPVPFVDAWPVNDLGSLFNVIRAWGCATSEGDLFDEASGQFVIAGDRAYFEVTVEPVE